jgi:hypothetical protein
MNSHLGKALTVLGDFVFQIENIIFIQENALAFVEEITAFCWYVCNKFSIVGLTPYVSITCVLCRFLLCTRYVHTKDHAAGS